VILANMPFGLKGIKHAECCERVNNLKIRGTKSEPLFLQLMMVSLALGGRCAVVVPDGMLVNSSSCHNDTRKYLLDHFELKRVIKMNGQYFMNTGIKPSILFFENTGKPTTAVEFWEVLRNEKGESTETMLVSVPRAKIDASCSFDMRRYLEGDKPVANPAGFPMVKLGDLYEVPKTIKKFNSGDMDNMGDSAFFNGKWDCPVGTHSEHSFTSDKDYFVLIKDGGGDHSSNTVGMGKFFRVKGKCSVTSHNLILVQKKEDDVTHKFVYYYMLLNIKALRDKARYSINLGSISMDSIMDFSIQLPPHSTQEEIVATLDRIYSPGTTELAGTIKMTDRAMDLVLASPGGATLEPIVEAQRLIRKSAQMVADVKAQMVADVKAQMVAIMKSVGSRGFDEKKLSDISDLYSGKANRDADSGDIPFFASSGAVGKRDKHNFEGKYIITARTQSIGSVSYYDGKLWASDNTILLKVKDEAVLTSRFLYYWLMLNKSAIHNIANTGLIPLIRKSDLAEIKMPLPPLDFQQSVLVRLEILQSQLTALESLQKQTEDNARFILDSYLPSTPVENTITYA
jgi:restriction endonuclease S subunit